MADILLVAVERDLVDRVEALPGHRVVSIDRDHLVGARTGEAADRTFVPDLIFVGSGMPIGRAIEYSQVIIGDYPGLSVVLVAPPEEDLVRRAASAGIRAVVSPRASGRQLAGLIERAANRTASARAAVAATQPHQVIVVASPKGGVGKTTTAINLAATLAESAPGEVIVIDLDLQFGDVSAMLDLSPAYTIADAFRSGVDDSMRLRTLLTPHPAQFHVLAASEHPAENGRVTGEDVRKLVGHYSSSFRYVILDTPAGLLEETLAGMEEATDVVFVATLDVATLRSLRREIEVLVDLSLLPPRRHLVLNRVDGRSGLTEKDAERIVGRPVDVVVPAHDGVSLAANEGELISAVRRRNPVRRPFAALATVVADLSGKGVPR